MYTIVDLKNRSCNCTKQWPISLNGWLKKNCMPQTICYYFINWKISKLLNHYLQKNIFVFTYIERLKSDSFVSIESFFLNFYIYYCFLLNKCTISKDTYHNSFGWKCSSGQTLWKSSMRNNKSANWTRQKHIHESSVRIIYATICNMKKKHIHTF